jgi:phage-related protein
MRDLAYEVPILRRLVWMGNAKKNLRAFPEGAQKLIGDELQLLQFGGMPADAKPFKGIGSGVFEIALRYDKNAYRTVVAVQLGNKLNPRKSVKANVFGHANH